MPRTHGAAYWLCVVTLSGCVVLTAYNFLIVPWLAAANAGTASSFSIFDSIFGDEPTSAAISHGFGVNKDCNWLPGGPVIYNMKTKLGVNYDAGHWFHMAENFMVQHSTLRETNRLTNASVVIYNFDKGLPTYCIIIL